jgi:PAS domain S-box-containing protein
MTARGSPPISPTGGEELAMTERLKTREQLNIELTEALDQLGDLKELYVGLMKASTDGIAVYDNEGKARYINPSFTEIFGWTIEEVEGKRIDFVPESEREETMAVIGTIVGGGGTLSGFETKRYNKNGNIVDVSISAARFRDHAGAYAGIIAVLSDISELVRVKADLKTSREELSTLQAAGGTSSEEAAELREINEQLQQEVAALKETAGKQRNLYEEARRAEEVYRSLLNHSTNAIQVYDLQGRTRYVNTAFTTMFGWTVDDAENDKMDFVPEGERDATSIVIGNVIRNRTSINGFDTKRLTKDGTVLDVTAGVSLYNDHHGNPAGILVLFGEAGRG